MHVDNVQEERGKKEERQWNDCESGFVTFDKFNENKIEPEDKEGDSDMIEHTRAVSLEQKKRESIFRQHTNSRDAINLDNDTMQKIKSNGNDVDEEEE